MSLIRVWILQCGRSGRRAIFRAGEGEESASYAASIVQSMVRWSRGGKQYPKWLCQGCEKASNLKPHVLSSLSAEKCSWNEGLKWRGSENRSTFRRKARAMAAAMAGWVVQWCCGSDGRPVVCSRGREEGRRPGRLGDASPPGKMGLGLPLSVQSAARGGTESCRWVRA